MYNPFSFMRNAPLKVEKLLNGSFFYTVFSSRRATNSMSTDREKLAILLTNPALLKAVVINNDLFSQARILVGGKPINEVYDKPNPFQTWTQWIYDYMLWHQLGTARLYITDTNIENSNLYWLDPSKLDYNRYNNTDKFFSSKKGANELLDQMLTYTYKDGTNVKIKRKSILNFFSLSNGASGDWFSGNSKIDSLYKVIQNVEQNLDTQFINLEYAGKFSFSNKTELNPTLPKPNDQKLSIETALASSQTIVSSKSPVAVQRFVDDIHKLDLPEQYLASYFVITSMFGIPRDVSEARLTGATNINIDSAIGRHVEYSLVSASTDLCQALKIRFGIDITMDWKHLTFNQQFELVTQDVISKKLDNFLKARDLGMQTPVIKYEEL